MPNWPTVTEQSDQVAMLRSELIMAQESIAELESLYREDVGWLRLGSIAQQDFSTEGRKRISDLAWIMLVGNPLIKRAMQLRVAYIWGQGVSISIRENSDAAQHANVELQSFLDHPANRDTFTGAQAHEDNENRLGADGEIFYCLPTDRITGDVVVRLLEPDEITDIITNPQDRFEPWYYKRTYLERSISLTTATIGQYEQKVCYYPALGYNPRGLDRLNMIDGKPVHWHSPVRHVAVNKPRKSLRGTGDIYPALPWARYSKEFLESWVLLTKALARYAWQATGPGDRASKAAAALRKSTVAPGNPEGVGATFVGPQDSRLEPVKTSGATVDADSGRPLQMMVAAAMGVPITMLLGDPGATGARAVAETLDQPTELVMRMRRDIHTEAIRDICDYRISWSVKASGGRLRGSVSSDGSREIVTLAGGEDRTVVVDWPDFDSEPTKEKVSSIRMAGESQVLPPELELRLYLEALKIAEVDEIMAANTDEQGRLIPFDIGQAEIRDRFARTGGSTGEES